MASGSSDAATSNAAIFARSGQSANRNEIVNCSPSPASDTRTLQAARQFGETHDALPQGASE
jgi:hypothetical protein